MSIWNRVQYPSKKTTLLATRDTFLITMFVGICSSCTVAIVSKIVSFYAS